MKEEHRKQVKKATLMSKEILEKDIENQLKKLGIYPDRKASPEKLNLSLENIQKRESILEVLDKLKQRELGDKTPQQFYAREVAYTYFNRIIAMYLMEKRGLLSNILEPDPEFGNKPEQLWHFEQITDIHQRDTLYQTYFDSLFNEINEEIKKVFDTEDENSILFPAANAIDEILDQLIEKIPDEAWKEEEIIGWMYQYFKSKEKDKAFEELQENKKKIDGSTLPAVSCIYTPHWIVRYLVDNTLGVLWKEMNPDSDIDEFCEYMIPDQEFEDREKKPVEEITLLDPACGSGHFLLYAYEVFEKIYEESGYAEEKIPEKILSNNLYGIDIDNRSVQLSALSLYIKGKTKNPSAKIKDVNLVSADAVLMDGEKKERLLKKCKKPVEKEIIKEIWDNFQHLDERGSLVKVKESVRGKIEQYRANLSEEEKKQQYLDQFSNEKMNKKNNSVQQKLAEKISTEDYWNMIEDRMMQRIFELGEEAIQSRDMSEQLFATETQKSLHLFDYLMAEYDCVTTNPPYLYRRNMNPKLRSFLDENYKIANKDLYSAFILRGIHFLKEKGLLGIITQQSYMFISTYEDLRKYILENCSIKTLIHLGTKAFSDISGEKVNTASYIIKNQPVEKKGIYYKLNQFEEKKTRFIENIDKGENRYYVDQDKFKLLPGDIFAYWLSDNFFDLFTKEKLSKVIDNANPTKTSNNDFYLRYFWEIPQDSLGETWTKYNKGVGHKRWFFPSNSVVRWDEESINHYKNDSSGRLTQEKYRHCSGISYSGIATKGFVARFLDSGYIFDVQGPMLFDKRLFKRTEHEDGYNPYLLGLLNSKLYRYMLNVLNTTAAVQAGDIKNLPYKEPSKKIENKVREHANKCVDYKKKLINNKEILEIFEGPSLLQNDGSNLKDRFIKHLNKSESLESSIKENEDLIDEIILDYYGIPQKDRKEIYDNIEPKLIDKEGEVSKSEVKRLYISGKEIPWGKGTRKKQLSVIDIAKELAVNPHSVIEARKEMGLYRKDELESEAKKLVSYFIQVCLGRWKMDGVEPDEDGILMVSEGVSEDNPSLIDKIRECIAAEWGESKVSDIESEINSVLYHGVEKWIEKYFFKNFHYKMYKKRPVVWQLQTPNNHFSAFIYYHKLDEDTLPKLDSIYINPLISYYSSQREIAEKNEDTVEAKKMDDKVQDLKEFQDQIGEIIDSGYEPDLDEGVKHNFKPLEHLTPVEMK